MPGSGVPAWTLGSATSATSPAPLLFSSGSSDRTGARPCPSRSSGSLKVPPGGSLATSIPFRQTLVSNSRPDCVSHVSRVRSTRSCASVGCTTKGKGDLAELKVARRPASRRGYRIALPYGRGLGLRPDRLPRGGDSNEFRSNTRRLATWRNRREVQLALADQRQGAGEPSGTRAEMVRLDRRLRQHDRPVLLHSRSGAWELGSRVLHLRLGPARNGQVARIRNAEDYRDLRRIDQVEPAGFEPATFRMQTGRSPS